MSVTQQSWGHVELILIFQMTAFCSESPIRYSQESLIFYEFVEKPWSFATSKNVSVIMFPSLLWKK